MTRSEIEADKDLFFLWLMIRDHDINRVGLLLPDTLYLRQPELEEI